VKKQAAPTEASAEEAGSPPEKAELKDGTDGDEDAGNAKEE